MRVLVSCIALLVGLSVLRPPDAAAISKRKQCRDACGAKIEDCVAQGGKKKKCRRQTLKSCRKQGFETCVVTTTTTTIRGASTTQVGATTTIAGGSTTTGPGGSVTTTTGPHGTTSTTIDDTPHGCMRSSATDLKSDGAPTVVFDPFKYTPRCILISDQPGIDQRHVSVDRRAGARRIGLARWWDRVLEGLTHRPTLCAMTIRQLADRQVIQTAISSDLLEQFHA